MQSKKLNLKILNNLNLESVDKKRFPLTKIISKLSVKDSLYETIIVSANDKLVNLFLDNKIKFPEIAKILLNILNSKEFLKYKHQKAKNIDEIQKLNTYVSLKIEQKLFKNQTIVV
ncbi:hypothetical protein [Candidatus Pelagibacter sp. Uisw_134_02]|uniref:hypothetical protein n=1 Tax=Candidatus Pelagibacter sp. Uisw_134_02 TaxID=3230990 RepID=UPI0039E7CF14